MASRFFTYCREAGCTVRHNNAGGYCDAHRGNNTAFRARQQRAADSKKNDPIWKLYNSCDWTKRFCPYFEASGNIICQRIVDGQRCTRPVEIRHHIISPRERPDLMYTPSNVVGVCRQHHPPTEGEPKENLARLAEIYVPTVWKEIRF